MTEPQDLSKPDKPVRLSIEIEPQLRRDLKSRAAALGTTMQAILPEIITNFLKATEPPSDARRSS